jgi:hypothetical protein
MKVKKLANLIQIVLWFASFSFLIIWIFDIPFCYQPEPITVMLGLISMAVSGLVNRYSHALDIEQYSVANVLAKGYVNNFVEPVLTQLIKDSNSKSDKPIFYIFIPELLSELTPKSIDRLKAKLKTKGLSDNILKVKINEGRGVRDVMTVSNSNNKNVFFDFPNTLFSLTDFVEFKMNSPKDSLNVNLKNKIGKEYIERFKKQLIESLEEKHLHPDYIRFTNFDLDIVF